MVTTIYCFITIYILTTISINTSINRTGTTDRIVGSKFNRIYGLPLTQLPYHGGIGGDQTKPTKKIRTKTTEDQNLNGPSPLTTLENQFPDKLNFFCQLITILQRDRFCYENMDANLLACTNTLPPLQLAPFCFGYHHVCSKLTYPKSSWCPKEYYRYRAFCTVCQKYRCSELSNFSKIDLTCTCEPYSCLQRRFGTRTAAWCQRYELFCDRKKRTEESENLMMLLVDAVRVRKECLEFLNVAKILCTPFKPDFDHGRCIKFLFDCELISS